MNVTQTTIGKYTTCSPVYQTYIGPNPGIYLPGDEAHVYGYTEIVYKVTGSITRETTNLKPFSHFDQGRSSDSDALAYYARHSINSVSYQNGPLRHDYNGVYHAKADGSLHSKVILDSSDQNPGSDTGRYNFFTGKRGPEIAWIGPSGLDIMYSAVKTGKTYPGNIDGEIYAHHHTFTVRYPDHMVVVHYSCSALLADRDMFGRLQSESSVAVALLSLRIDPSNNSVYTTDSVLRFSDAGASYLSWAKAHGYVRRDYQSYAMPKEVAFADYIKFVNEDGIRAYIDEQWRDRRPTRQHGLVYKAKSAKVDLNRLSNSVAQLCQSAENEYFNSPHMAHIDWNDLAYQAYQDIGMWSGNGMQYLGDIAHLTADTKRLVKTLQSLGGALKGRKLKLACKAVSAAYLSFHYGVKLSLQDTKELAKVITSPDVSFGRKKAQASTSFTVTNKLTGNDWNVAARYQLFYNTKKAMDNTFIEYLHMLDIVPDLSNIWDMIPYSFVIDWFIKIGDLLSAIDNYSSICSRYDVEAAGQSMKFTRTLNPDELGLPLDGELSFSIYVRSYSNNAVIPIPSHLVTSTNPFTHSVEAGALLVSK